MSIQFNDTTNFRGLVQLYEREIGKDRGYVSDNTNRLKEFTADANNAWDAFLMIALPASGTWQVDDTSHTDYPIITADLTSGQRSYTYGADEQGNLILDFYRVLIADRAGVFHDIIPKDAQRDADTQSFWDGRGTTGQPTAYDKTGNGLFFDLVPDYTVEDGIKIYVNREANYFVYGDTTKKPGCPGILHSWFYIEPAWNYARQKDKERYNRLTEAKLDLETAIKAQFSRRTRDEKPRFVPAYQINR
jgi:hypothetical protein